MKENISRVSTDDISLFPLLIYNFQNVKITNSSVHPVESPYLCKHSKESCIMLFAKLMIPFLISFIAWVMVYCKNVKATSWHAYTDTKRNLDVQLQPIHCPGVKWGSVFSTTPRPLYPLKRTGTHCIRDWMVFQGPSIRALKTLLPPGNDPRTIQPVAVPYTNYVIPTGNGLFNLHNKM